MSSKAVKLLFDTAKQAGKFESLQLAVANTTVISVVIESDVLTANFRPIFPKAQYLVTLLSTTTQSFQTVNGEAIFEDGNRNVFFIVSPGNDQNNIRDEMLESLPLRYNMGFPWTKRGAGAPTRILPSPLLRSIARTVFLRIFSHQHLKDHQSIGQPA